MRHVAWAAHEECDFRALSAATSSIVGFQNKSVREEPRIRYLAWTFLEVLTEKDKVTFVLAMKWRRDCPRRFRRGVDLRNIDQEEPALSSIGHARQELKIKQGLEGNKAKEIIQAIKSQGFKVQSQLQDQQIRVTGKKKDELQTVIQFVRSRDFGVATNFKNFRD